MAEFPLLMTVSQLVQATGGTCLCDFSDSHGFTGVVTDSRNVQPGFLFVPLMGEFQDGHSFIPRALESGASVVLVDGEHGDGSASLFFELARARGAAFVRVPNTLRALQDAARAYVDRFPSLHRVGITGSSGKTTTKEIVASIFSRRYRVVMNEGNLNSETGLPLSVFKIRADHQVGIFELGMNRRGEMDEIASVLRPSLALVTNVGTAHIGILGSQDAIAEEKKRIFAYFDSSSVGFVPEDDTYRDFLARDVAGEIRTFGLRSTGGVTGTKALGIDGTQIEYEGLSIQFPLPGPYNLSNALGAISLAREAGIGAREVKEGLEAVKPLFGRAEIIRGPITVILDCYNANPDSMESAIHFYSRLEWPGRKILVLGSMLELGAESAEAHRMVCASAAASPAEKVFLFGDDIVAASAGTDWRGKDARSFGDIESLSAALERETVEGDLVFVKGSRGMALERVCPALSRSGKVTP